MIGREAGAIFARAAIVAVSARQVLFERDEFALLLRVGALTEDEARAANDRGHEASFLAAR